MKKIWLIFGILMLVFVPLKIVSIFHTLEFVQSGWFTLAFFLVILLMSVITYFTKLEKKNIEIRRNIPLSVASLFLAAGFFWCISTYYVDNSQYDFEWQPVVMAIFSLLSCVTFLFMSAVFLTGKNLFSKFSFLVFCPVLWFAFDMILFLSIQNDNADVYDITLTALFSLFFLYMTQVFFTSSKLNIIKLIIGIGAPAVVLTFVKCVPVIIRMLNNYSAMAPVEVSTCFVESFAALFIAFIMFEACRQVSERPLKINSQNL